MSSVYDSGGRSWRLRCQVVVAAEDWPRERLLGSDGYGTEAEASFYKWAWYSMRACLFAGAGGMNGSS